MCILEEGINQWFVILFERMMSDIEFFFGNYSEYADWLEERRLEAGEGPESNSAKYRKLSL